MISIHAPLAGRDEMERLIADANALFQSTRPSRGATGTIRAAITGRRSFQSTRPSRGATGVILKWVDLFKFQSTRPSRGATHCACTTGATSGISIHAPLAGRDQERADGLEHRLDFNPRAPRGARQQMCTKITYIFALTHKRNTFSCQTPSVRALSKKLSGRFSHKIRCEPPCKTMCAAAPHYTISVPSGRYVCLQPKCSILLSYFFPK